MAAGILKWYDQEKGFGVIAGTDGEEYFLHNRNIAEQEEKFTAGFPVVFEEAFERERKTAKKAHPSKEYEDLAIFLLVLFQNEQNDFIEYEELGKPSGRSDRREKRGKLRPEVPG